MTDFGRLIFRYELIYTLNVLIWKSYSFELRIYHL